MADRVTEPQELMHTNRHDLGPRFFHPAPAAWIVYNEHTCFCRQPAIPMSWKGVTLEGVTYKRLKEIWLQRGALQGGLCTEHSDSAPPPTHTHTHPRPPKHTDATNPFLTIPPHTKGQASLLAAVNESPFYLKVAGKCGCGVSHSLPVALSVSVQ